MDVSPDTINKAVLVGAGVAIGAGLGYILALKTAVVRLEKEYGEDLERIEKAYKIEVVAARKGYEDSVQMREAEESAPDILDIQPTQAEEEQAPFSKEELEDHKKIVEYQGYSLIQEAEDSELEEVLALRENSRIYPLLHDEFMESDSGYTQAALTYFIHDDVLIDDQENLVDDVVRTVGENGLEWFGLGSEDETVAYIRNENFEAEYEIIRSGQSYAKMYYGIDPELDPELEHENKPRKFREHKAE